MVDLVKFNFYTWRHNMYDKSHNLQKLLIQIEDLKKQTNQLFEELNLSPEQFSAYITNKDNFSPSEWEMLQQEQKKLDEKLDLSLNNVKDTKKTGQAFKDLHISRNWLFVR